MPSAKLPEDYTADAICQAMGLPGFVEQAWAAAEAPTLRLVLTPSFRPEVCITVSRTSNAVQLSVVALNEQFWSQRSGVSLPTVREEVCLASADFDALLALFRAADEAFDPQQRCVCIDGMGSESCLVSRAGTRRILAHVSANRPVRQLVAHITGLAWNVCRQARVRNALSQAARYLEIEYPLQEVSPQPSVTQLAVLGTPEQKEDYFEMLRQSKKRKA